GPGGRRLVQRRPPRDSDGLAGAPLLSGRLARPLAARLLGARRRPRLGPRARRTRGARPPTARPASARGAPLGPAAHPGALPLLDALSARRAVVVRHHLVEAREHLAFLFLHVTLDALLELRDPGIDGLVRRIRVAQRTDVVLDRAVLAERLVDLAG